MDKKDVNYKVRYIKESWSDWHQNEIYDCVGEWYDENGALRFLAVIDSSGFEYSVSPKAFEILKSA